MVFGCVRALLTLVLAVMSGGAAADAIYMQTGADGSVQFRRAPQAPRYVAYAVKERRSPSPSRPSRFSPLDNPCTNSVCDRERLERLINDVARGYGIESALLHAIIEAESSYNPFAVSPNGAIGLMQLMPPTAKRYGVEDMLDPVQNLIGGTRYLRDLLSRFSNDLHLAVAAYQAGEYAVERYRNSIPPFKATIDYVAKVMSSYHERRERNPH